MTTTSANSTIGDRMTYLVICMGRDGLYSPERYVSDMDRASVVKAIAHGDLSDAVQVIEINPVERICNDVTAEIMQAVDDECEEPVTAADRQAAAWDHARDLRKHEAAA